MRSHFQYLFVICILFFSLMASAEDLSSPVVDDAAVFNTQDKATLISAIDKFRASQSIWLVVHTLPTLAGEPINDYAERKFREWRIGEKGKDNGLLLILAMSDRKMRIEVGYGLEGIITDFKSAAMIDTHLRPALREDKPLEGILSMIQDLEGTTSSERAKKAESWEERKKVLEPYFTVPASSMTPEERNSLFQLFDIMHPHGVDVAFVTKESGINIIPAHEHQRVVFVIDGKTLNIERDEGLVNDEWTNFLKQSFETEGYAGLIKAIQSLDKGLQDQERRSQEKNWQAERAAREASREISEKEASQMPWWILAAQVVIFPLVTFRRMFRERSYARSKFETEGLNNPHLSQFVQKLRSAESLFYILAPVLVLGVWFSVMLSNFEFGNFGFNPEIHIVFIMVSFFAYFFLSSIALIILGVFYVATRHWMKKSFLKEYPHYAKEVQSIMSRSSKVPFATGKSSGRSGSSSWSSSSSRSSSSSSSSRSSSSGGGRSGGGGASGSW